MKHLRNSTLLFLLCCLVCSASYSGITIEPNPSASFTNGTKIYKAVYPYYPYKYHSNLTIDPQWYNFKSSWDAVGNDYIASYGPNGLDATVSFGEGQPNVGTITFSWSYTFYTVDSQNNRVAHNVSESEEIDQLVLTVAYTTPQLNTPYTYNFGQCNAGQIIITALPLYVESTFFVNVEAKYLWTLPDGWKATMPQTPNGWLAQVALLLQSPH